VSTACNENEARGACRGVCGFGLPSEAAQSNVEMPPPVCHGSGPARDIVGGKEA
jgi:hypothetical protein